MTSDGADILIEALRAAVIRLDDARAATDAFQGALRGAEVREQAMQAQLELAEAHRAELREQVGMLQLSLDEARRGKAEAEGDCERWKRAAQQAAAGGKFEDYVAQVPR